MSEATSLSRGDAARLAKTIMELQNLKTRIQQIENRYDILDHEYARICEEVIEALLREKTQGFPEVNVISNAKEHSNLKGDMEKGAAHIGGAVKTAIPESVKSVDSEGYSVSQASLEDLVLFQRSKKVSERVSGLSPQKVIDITADAIETGLDKLGDGLIFPMVRLYELVQRLKRIK